MTDSAFLEQEAINNVPAMNRMVIFMEMDWTGAKIYIRSEISNTG